MGIGIGESLIVTVPGTCSNLVDQVMQCLTSAGFYVDRSFDLQSAMAAHKNCTCPYHGTNQCTCQYAVLLAYEEDAPPVTLVVHENHSRGELTLLNSPEQRMDARVKAHLLSAIDAWAGSFLG